VSGRVAVVLAGGGARGAYEAGALSVLLPALEARGERPEIVVGTSVGALNAAFLAATAHEPAADVAAKAREIWGSIGYDDVLEPLVSAGSLGRLAGYLGEAFGIPRARALSVLDPSPLARTLPERIDFAQLRRNVDEGAIATAAVVATSARTQRSVVFHHGGTPGTAHDD
jgi:NTE family protein